MPKNGGRLRGRLAPLFIAFVLLIAAMILVPLSAAWLTSSQQQGYERTLPAALITGVIALIIALAGLILLLNLLGLSDKRAALGMPEGSVRAVIALMLILLFSIMAVFLYSSIRFTNAQFLAQAADNAAIASSLAASEDIARQILTTIGTLVVAISAFYFGSNSVTSAASGVASQSGNTEDRLGKLADLLDKGVLTQDEFDHQKAIVLGADSEV
jgi:hypothetical protein